MLDNRIVVSIVEPQVTKISNNLTSKLQAGLYGIFTKESMERKVVSIQIFLCQSNFDLRVFRCASDNDASFTCIVSQYLRNLVRRGVLPKLRRQLTEYLLTTCGWPFLYLERPRFPELNISG